jgi:methionine-R-sulfoxide reductase
MKTILPTFLFLLLINACNSQKTSDQSASSVTDVSKKYNVLTDQERRVLIDKATDPPFTGNYYNNHSEGIYICKMCNNPLYNSTDKFDSHCGWPSFDQEINGSVLRFPDADGMRTEIVCANCKGHLGHVFLGEGFTDKNTRHCVNTSSLKFVNKEEMKNLPTVIK